ncbi:hypothetical protein K1719_008366 [Acacia pycnantha]|nr:hypothetical protein K1719_008366 [Acacia pycnantha]
MTTTSDLASTVSSHKTMSLCLNSESRSLRSQNHRETELLLGVLSFYRNNLPIKLFLKWTMIVEILSENKKKLQSLKMDLGIRVPLMSLTLVGIGTPRDYSFMELKKATNNFSEKNKLGRHDDDFVVYLFEALDLQGTVNCAPNDMAWSL